MCSHWTKVEWFTSKHKANAKNVKVDCFDNLYIFFKNTGIAILKENNYKLKIKFLFQN